MNEEHPHPLLQQVPLTISPFISLPTATPLPYTFKSLPSTLPPSVTDSPASSGPLPEEGPQQARPKPAYVVSAATGHSAHPDQIIDSCRALQQHLAKLQQDAEATLKKWQDDIKERDLAEKRRVAPGWLDVGEGERMLVPERIGDSNEIHHSPAFEVPAQSSGPTSPVVATSRHDPGTDLDKAFGGLSMR